MVPIESSYNIYDFLLVIHTNLPPVLHRSCALLRRLKFSPMFLRHLVRWPSADIQVKFYGDRPRETPPLGELNKTGVAEYIDFGPIESYISETVKVWSEVCINH